MKQKNVQDIHAYNKYLNDKLQHLEKQKQTFLKSSKKPATSPIGTRLFTPSTNEYDHVQSQMDYELIKEHGKIKEAERSKLKEQTELARCSFKPSINAKSANYVKNMNYTPVHERKPREKTPNKAQEQEEVPQIESGDKNKAKKKLNPDFFQKQLDWQNSKIEKLAQKKLQLEDAREPDPVPIPKLNTQFNKKVLKNRPVFLERVNEYRMKTQTLHRELDSKYYSYPFKPTINNKSLEATSRTRDNTLTQSFERGAKVLESHELSKTENISKKSTGSTGSTVRDLERSVGVRT